MLQYDWNGMYAGLTGMAFGSLVAADLGLKVLAKLPIDPALAAACDNGGVEDYQPNPLSDLAKALDEGTV